MGSWNLDLQLDPLSSGPNLSSTIKELFDLLQVPWLPRLSCFACETRRVIVILLAFTGG